MTTTLKSDVFNTIQQSIILTDTPSLLPHASLTHELVAYVTIRLGESLSPHILVLIHRFATLCLQFPTKDARSVVNNVAIISAEPPSSVASLVQWLDFHHGRIRYIDIALSTDEDIFTAERLLSLAYTLWAEQALQYTREFLLSKVVYV